MTSSIRARFISFAVMAFGALLSSPPAHADTFATRCAADTQNPTRARQRLEWARMCGNRMNLGSPTSPRAPSFAYPLGLTSANGIALWEYIETDDFWGKNSYSGDVAAVNQVFTQNQWRTGPYTVSTDAWGFQKWTESSSLLLARPMYPTFSTSFDINSGTPLYPNPDYSLLDCSFYTDHAATHLANTSVTGFYVNGFCSSNDIACGNGTCNSGENSSTCPQDCSPCGDGFCTFNETVFSCPGDCGFCGDGICSVGESSLSCPEDCGGGTCGCGGLPRADGGDEAMLICPQIIICSF